MGYRPPQYQRGLKQTLSKTVDSFGYRPPQYQRGLKPIAFENGKLNKDIDHPNIKGD